jgi:tetratricopeptide (TPR) repeat protein
MTAALRATSAASMQPVAPAPPVGVRPVAVPPVAALVPAPSARQICKSELTRERVAKALAACRRVVDAEPRSADALVLLAQANLIAGHESETLRLARLAAGIDPRCAEAFLLIGNVEQTLGRKADARAAYQAYLRLAPHGAYAADVRAIVPTL